MNNNQAPQISEEQQRFLSAFLTQAGEQAIGKKFDLVDQANRRYLRWEQLEIPVNISFGELLGLARLGYLQIYSEPPAISFTEKALKKSANLRGSLQVSNEGDMSPSRKQVLKVDICQVYAWLFATLLAAGVSLCLLWLTVQQVLAQNISTSIASAITTAISGLLSHVFFKNYDQANEHLKHLRSKLPDTEKQEEINK